MNAELRGFRDPDEIERTWKAAARELGGRYGVVPGWNKPVIQVDGDHGRVTVEVFSSDVGPLTRARAPFRAREPVQLSVRGEGWLTGVGKALGFVQDIELGRTDFDDRFVARGFPVHTVKALLAPPVVDLIVAQPFVQLGITPGGPPAFPPGLAELEVRRALVVHDPRELVGLVRIAQALLPRLDPVSGPVNSGDHGRLVERLRGPGGHVRDYWTRLVVWDGDPPRRDAARRLGESGDLAAVGPLVEVLDDDDPVLVVTAVRALRRLEAVDAIPHLVVLLGRREDVVEERTVAGHAGDALRSFGHDALVDAFEGALDGDPTPLEAATGKWRGEVVTALMEVLDSFDLVARVEAARALGALGARRALPLLREKTKAMGLRTRLSRTAREAVDAIESRASLPRPAASDAPDEVDTLPRPAEGADRDEGGETLPRAT